jgi:hypothetical protein
MLVDNVFMLNALSAKLISGTDSKIQLALKAQNQMNQTIITLGKLKGKMLNGNNNVMTHNSQQVKNQH